MSINSWVHSPTRAFAHPRPHSGSLRKRTDSSMVGSTKIASPPTGGICKKSPTRTICTPPNGTLGTCLYLRSILSSFNHSGFDIIDTSSMTSASSVANDLSWITCLMRMRKLANVRAPISLAQNVLTASMIRLLPVPPAPPRNMSSCSSLSFSSKSCLLGSVVAPVTNSSPACSCLRNVRSSAVAMIVNATCCLRLSVNAHETSAIVA
eukprot:jgi/Phyca11/104981/e_gw1.10.338.1